MRYIFLYLWLACICINAAAQRTETLTNASVIALHKAGFEDELIITKIESSTCKFDVSTTGMIALKNGGLSKELIQAVMSKAGGKKPAPVKVQEPEKVPAKPVVFVPAPESINYVNFYDKGTQTITPLERGTAIQKVEKKALGYGGADIVYELAGEKSTARITADKMVSFIVNTGGGSADIFVLYKVGAKKDKRKAVASHIGMGANKGSKGLIIINVRQLTTSVFELVPGAKLEKGEYFFAVKSATNATTSNADVYAFGLD